jgi:hypothetical protein
MQLLGNANHTFLLFAFAALIAAAGCGGSGSQTGPDSATTTDASVLDGGTASDGDVPGDAGPGSDAAVVDDALHPVLSNFRVEDAHHDRVYFDSSELITGTTATGFVVSGRTVTGNHVQPGSTTGHYFTVDEAFTFWDNNTLRYEGGSDVQDEQGDGPYPFTLEHIVNAIDIAEGTTAEYYVAVDGDDNNSGTGIDVPFASLQRALDVMVGGGNMVWVKAGTYSEGAVAGEPYLSDASEPNVIEGYKLAPGDISTNYYSYVPLSDVEFDPTEMPLFDGGTRENGLTFFNFGYNQYYIVRNIQIRRYNKGIIVQNSQGMVFERVNIKDLGAIPTGSENGTGIGFSFSSTDNLSYRMRVRSSTVINATLDGILVYGNHALIEDTKVYCNEYDGANPDGLTTDYYFAIKGSDSIIKGSTCHKDTPGGHGHGGHGFSLKTAHNDPEPDWVVYRNLVVGCTAINIKGSFQVRHDHARYNVFKDSEAHAAVPNRKEMTEWVLSGAVDFTNGGRENIFERLYVHDLDCGISFRNNSGEHDPDPGYDIQRDSVVRNCVFSNLKMFIKGENHRAGDESAPMGTRIHNNTIHTADSMFWIKTNEAFVWGETNEFVNNIIAEVPIKYDASGDVLSGWSWERNNLHMTWGCEGTDCVTDDPLLDSGLELTAASPASVTQGGLTIPSNYFDMGRVERTPPYSIGAFEIDP